MKKYLPKSLAGQLIAVLLLALVIAQATSLVVLHDDRRLAFLFTAERDVLSRTVAVTNLLNKSDAALHQTIVEAASGQRLRFQLDTTSAITADTDRDHDEANRFLHYNLSRELRDEVREIRVAVEERDDHARRNKDEDEDDDDHDDDDDDDDDDDKYSDRTDDRDWQRPGGFGSLLNRWRESRHRMDYFRRHLPGPVLDMAISLALETKDKNAYWLNVHSSIPPAGPAIAILSVVTMAIMAVLLVVVVVFMVRRVTRPLGRLADNAERFGRGEDIDLLVEQGPQDIRQATRAFNQMQERLTRFVRDRTLMLAAIAHDLRTPITSLRIRAEMIEEGENRDRILETLAEMQSLTEAALEFARQSAESEDARQVDIVALVDSVCADMVDLGQDVQFNPETDRLPWNCRPVALKRVLRNLIENAVRYGDLAVVTITDGPENLCISIEDNGPGISVDDRERVFEPFVRLEDSRNRETGGIGLGLAIARTIVRSHGGDITISDSEAGGAIFSILLPPQTN